MGRKGSYNVKILAENWTKAVVSHMHMHGNVRESTYVYYRQRERLQGRLLTDNGDSIMETHKKSAIDSQFSICTRMYVMTSARSLFEI